MYKRNVKKVILLLTMLFAPICVAIGTSQGVFAKTSDSVLMSKALANGILRCYSSDYMEDGKDGSVLAANVYNVSTLIVGNSNTFGSGSGGFSDGILKVPSKYGNSLKDDDISCYQLFVGWDGLFSGHIDGLLKNNQQLKGGSLLTTMGYTETTVGDGSICVAYEYYLKGGSYKTNKLCYKVNENGTLSSTGWSIDNSEKDGPFYLSTSQYSYKTIEVWNSEMYDGCFDSTVGYTCTNPTVFGVKDGMTVDEFRAVANNGGAVFNNATWNADSFVKTQSGSSLKSVDIGSSDIYKNWEIDDWGEAANDAIKNLTTYSNANEIMFTTQEKYDLYIGYLLGSNSIYELYVIGDRCSGDKNASDRSIPVKNGSDLVWCELGGVFDSDKKVNIFADGESRYLDENVGLMGVITAVRSLNVNEIGLASVDLETGEVEETIEIEDSGEVSDCYAGSGTLGWLICPVVKMLSGIGEHMWNQIETYHLKLPANDLFKNDGGVQMAWGTVRDIANILFVILFLFVIFSQLTGIGIDNYGIKKILPKLIVTAILINLSFWICALAVDFSNILGTGANSLLTEQANNVATASGMSGGAEATSWVMTSVLGGGGTALFVALNPAGALAAMAAIGLAVLGLLITIVTSMFFMYITLIAREAGVILMIVVAPVAIACYMLPNTEKIYKKWFDLFKALLIVYPICGALVGAGQLAGAVLASIDSENMRVAAMLVQVVPFFLLPMIIRNSLSLMGNIGNRLATWGRTLGRRGSNAAQGAIRNTRGFQEWSKYQQEQASANRAQRLRDRLYRRSGGNVSNMSARDKERYLDAVRTVNSRTQRRAEASVGAMELDSTIALQRAQSSRDAQEFRAYQDQFAGFDKAALAREANNASSWLNSNGGTQRMAALIGAMEAQGMERDIFTMLHNNDVSGRAGVMQTLANSKNKVLKAYGKKGYDSKTGTRVDFDTFMTGTGSQSLQSYINSKGSDFINGLDDKALAQIKQYENSSGTTIMSNDLLVASAAQLNDEDSMTEINEMLRSRAGSGQAIRMSGEQLSRLNDSTVVSLLASNSGRAALLNASDDLARNTELVNRMNATSKTRINSLRGLNGRTNL